MMNKQLITLLTFICQLVVIPTAIAAQSIENLVNQDKLTITAKINEKQQHIVGQAIVITIEISTERWFATGSQIQYFTLTDVVMQANNVTTINGSRRTNGETWVTQTHEITLYPTTYGDYQVPSINVDVSVNTENDGIISGVLSTQEITFNITLPEELKNIDNFIVSPQVNLTIDGQFDEAKDYVVGEAVTQTITINASNIPAMMIPPMTLVVNGGRNDDKSAVDGVSIYHKPAQIFDKSNRGTLLGTRVESFTYIFEKPGSYTVDEQVIYWWNSQSNTLERLLIPSSTWNVSGGGLSQVSPDDYIKGVHFTVEKTMALVIVIALLIVIFLSFRKRHDLSTLYHKLTKREQRLLRKSFFICITNSNYLAATQYLYQYTLVSDKKTLNKSCPLSIKLNQLAFNGNKTEKTTVSFTINEAKALIKEIDTSSSIEIKKANFTPNERIKLNSE
jgi:hypothetical protein